MEHTRDRRKRKCRGMETQIWTLRLGGVTNAVSVIGALPRDGYLNPHCNSVYLVFGYYAETK